jgi:hypothetical protein
MNTAQREYDRSFRPLPAQIPNLSLVPLEQGPAIRTVAPYLGGFVPRIAPLTKAEREAVLAGDGLALEQTS